MRVSARTHMDFKRIFRGPLVYIVLGAIILIVGFNLLTASGFRSITTQQGLELLNGTTVEKVKIVDGEQRVDLTLDKPYSVDGVDYGTQVQFYYVTQRGDEVVEAITDSKAAYNDEVPQTNWFTSLLGILIPFLLIGLIFWFLFSSMQGGGNRVM